MGTDLVEGNLLQAVKELIRRVDKLERSDVHVQELSEIADDIGLIMAGEIRVPFDILDPSEPGEGFSGVRILGEFEYPAGSGTYYAIVGVNNDAFMFGLSAETGAGVFGGGNITLDIDGITGTDLLKWIIKQTATSGANTRTGKLLLMLEEGGGDTPVWGLTYTSPTGAELMSNGGFEDGDFTAWTKTTETDATWNMSSTAPYYISGGLARTASGTDTLVLTSDRVVVSGLTPYEISAELMVQINTRVPAVNTMSVVIKWYDHASAGSLLQTDTIISKTITAPESTTTYSSTIESLSSALSAEIIITSTATFDSSFNYSTIFKGFSIKAVTVNQKLWLGDDGAACTNGLYPTAHCIVGDVWLGDQDIFDYHNDFHFSCYSRLTAANAESSYTYFLLKKGTYDITITGQKANNKAKADTFLDDVEIDTAKDWYASTTATDHQETWTSIAVTYSGLHKLEIKADGKNASSSGYGINISSVSFKES